MNEVQYLGNYLGIVIQNNDPERRGRVKVFIPHIAATLYDGWNKTFKDGSDKHFVFPDKETNPDLHKILPYLKESLPWAEIALSPFGGSSSGRFNAFKNKGSTSDSNYWDADNIIEGFRPVQNYTSDNRISDAFSETNASNNHFTNPNANQYMPSDYSNLARGIFTNINVGAHVWVFFNAGDTNYPVVFAISQGTEDWQRIYSMQKESDKESKHFTSPDYPESYENLSSEEKNNIDHNIKTFRAKHVINSNKHVFEMIDTDLAEILKMTHYSGSFLEFNNTTTTRLATNNDQLMVLGDQFLTIRRNQSIYVANYQDNIINGDRSTKIGNLGVRRKIVLSMLDIMKDTHQYKRLFETCRTVSNTPHTSPLQMKIGEASICPVCSGTGMKMGSTCITCDGTGKSPSSQNGSYYIDTLKNSILLSKMISNQNILLDYEAKFGNGGDDIETITGNRVTTVGAAFNDMESYRIDAKGKLRNEGVAIGKNGTYLTMAAFPLVEYVDVDSIPGGDWDIVVGNKYTLNVGSKGIRLKTTGPVDIYGSIMNIMSESLNLTGKHELLMQSDERVEIRGKTISLHPFDGLRSSVLIDGQLNVKDNVKVIGGAHIEGEFSYLHSTTPFEWYETDVGVGPGPHIHRFKAPPWTLMDTQDDVRSSQQSLNQTSPGFRVPV